MRYVIIASCIMLCVSAETPQVSYDQDIRYNASPYPVITNNNNISIPINIQAIYNFTQTIKNNVKLGYDKFFETTNTCSTWVAAYYEKAYNTIADHPIYASLATIAIWHTLLNSYAWWLAYQLEQPSCWSKWKYHLSNEELQQYPAQTIGYDLVCEIQRRYTDAQSPDQFVTPLITFSEAISTEYRMLRRYKWICYAIEWSAISRLAYYDTHLYQIVDMRMQRLDHIWNTFISWLAELKIANPQKFSWNRACKEMAFTWRISYPALQRVRRLRSI